MTFNPDNYEEVQSGMVPNGEYLMRIAGLKRDCFAGGTEYLYFTLEVVSNYDGDQDNANAIGKSVKRKFFFTEKATKMYAQWCRDLGVGAHDADSEYDNGNGKGLRDVWLNRLIVGTVSGKRDDRGYPDYMVWSPRAATATEYETFGAKTPENKPLKKDEVPF